jgi:hypothetical protein
MWKSTIEKIADHFGLRTKTGSCLRAETFATRAAGTDLGANLHGQLLVNRNPQSQGLQIIRFPTKRAVLIRRRAARGFHTCGPRASWYESSCQLLVNMDSPQSQGLRTISGFQHNGPCLRAAARRDDAHPPGAGLGLDLHCRAPLSTC